MLITPIRRYGPAALTALTALLLLSPTTHAQIRAGLISIATDVSGLGAGIATALGVNVGSAGSVVVNGGALGTPSSGTLTNATGLPAATGISGLGTGVANALGTAVSGSGGIALTNGATLTAPSIGSATGSKLDITINGIGSADYATADDGLTLFNSTAATAGTPLQASPNGPRWQAQSWISGANHVSQMTMALQPATVNMLDGRPGHTLFWYSTTDGGTPTEAMRLQGNGNLITRSSIDSALNNGDSGDLSTAANGGIYWRNTGDSISPSRVVMSSPAQGKWRLSDSASGNRRVEFNTGTAVVTCSTGCSPGTNANNSVGSLTITGGAASYTLTFATPSWTGTPICLVVNAGAGSVAPLTAASATAFTFTAAANGSFYYHCLGNA